MKTAGIILLIMGIAGTLYYGSKALSNSEAFNFLGIEVAVSSGNWTPVVISAFILIIGVVLVWVKRK